MRTNDDIDVRLAFALALAALLNAAPELFLLLLLWLGFWVCPC